MLTPSRVVRRSDKSDTESHGILITPALFPAVPLDSGALRFTVTAANTEGQVRLALEALRMVRDELFPPEDPPTLAVPVGGTVA